MEGILSGKKDGLIAEATRREVSSDGTVPDIRQRIVADMVSKSEPVPARWLPPGTDSQPKVDEEDDDAGADAGAEDVDAAVADVEAQIRAATAQLAARKEQEEFLLLEQIAVHEAKLEKQASARAAEARMAALRARLAALQEELDAPLAPPAAKVTEVERAAQEQAAKVQALQASLDAAVAASAKAKAAKKSGPRIARRGSGRRRTRCAG